MRVGMFKMSWKRCMGSISLPARHQRAACGAAAADGRDGSCAHLKPSTLCRNSRSTRVNPARSTALPAPGQRQFVKRRTVRVVVLLHTHQSA